MTDQSEVDLWTAVVTILREVQTRRGNTPPAKQQSLQRRISTAYHITHAYFHNTPVVEGSLAAGGVAVSAAVVGGATFAFSRVPLVTFAFSRLGLLYGFQAFRSSGPSCNFRYRYR
ncbi:hypothetical protein Agub_g2531 [Astrephomene gubernaculifera]|uniref:Uncharacterized protein n=1 Tax=Astrephomene gubernaculifera TaxID=47775 RepID=A0AAD3DJW2_9CHLO|nr:hypothetical protein Agub_g2531 [Astrephomene gubernaculifera]